MGENSVMRGWKGMRGEVNVVETSHKLIDECSICGNVDMINPCNICSDVKRDKKSICIIEDVSDLWTFERIGFYKGMYHVLGGTLSAINGIGVEEINVNKMVLVTFFIFAPL